MKLLKAKNSIIIFVIVGLVVAPVLFGGVRVANDYPVVSTEDLISRFGVPQTWTNTGAVGLGEYSVSTLWNWPVNFAYGLLAQMGFAFSQIEKILGVLLFMLLGTVASVSFLTNKHSKRIGVIAGSIFYLTNTYVILLLDGGQINIALAYALFPLVFVYFSRALTGRLRTKLIYSLLVTLLGALDIRVLYLLALVLVVEIMFKVASFESKQKTLRQILSLAFLTGFVYLSLNAYWLMPSFLFNSPMLPLGYSSPSQPSALSFANIGHAMLMLAPHWYKNVFGNVTQLLPIFFVWPVAMLIAIARSRKNIVMAKWITIYVLGVFLTKGALDPYPSIYLWLFNNIPGFSMFRDPTKFYFLIGMPMAYFISVLFSRVNIRFLALFLLIIALQIFPVWRNQMTGLFSEPVFKNEYRAVSERLGQDSKFGRVLWIPSLAPLGHSSPTHPSVEAFRLLSLRPFASGVVGSYEKFNYLREAPYLGDLLAVSNISYIVYSPTDTRRQAVSQEDEKYRDVFANQIFSKAWMSGHDTLAFARKTVESKERFFIVDNTIAVVGGTGVYFESLRNSNLKLVNSAYVFLEDYENGGQILKDLPTSQIYIENNRTKLDLQTTFIKSNYKYSPAKVLQDSPNASGWWKRDSYRFLDWRVFLQNKYQLDTQDLDTSYGWAISEGENTLAIPVQTASENNVLLVRAMKSPRGGKLIFNGNDEIGTIETKESLGESSQRLSGYGNTPDKVFEYEQTSLSWFVVGEFSEKIDTLIVSSQGDINAINSIAILPAVEWNNIVENSGKLESKIVNNLYNVPTQAIDGNVVYKRISPTKYQVEVKNLSAETTLVFSETYNEGWRLDGQRPYPVYNFLNGFKVSKDGVYTVSFYPQKYAEAGLAISALSALILLIIFCIARKQRLKKV
ncbi:hypothetical protein C4564_04200 [Candidatus Microgenomates bacterium]|nr:MAG: hypothetical protein C4564_04200 [Candidatus Microgenomates bacterium]